MPPSEVFRDFPISSVTGVTWKRMQLQLGFAEKILSQPAPAAVAITRGSSSESGLSEAYEIEF